MAINHKKKGVEVTLKILVFFVIGLDAGLEEFLVENVIDRVETTSTVWLGLTMGCARCHDHKYDPLSQREFFQMYAYFNNIGERGTGKGVSANPLLKIASPIVEAPKELLTAVEKAEAFQPLDQGI